MNGFGAKLRHSTTWTNRLDDEQMRALPAYLCSMPLPPLRGCLTLLQDVVPPWHMHHCAQVQHMRLVRYVLPRPLWPRGAAGARLQPPHLRVSAAARVQQHPPHTATRRLRVQLHGALRMDGTRL